MICIFHNKFKEAQMDLGVKNVSRKWISLFFAAGLVLNFSVSPCHALFGGKIDSFSADHVDIDPNGNVINSARFYVTKDAMRIDGLPGAGMGSGPKMNLTMLMLKDQKKTYFYNHDKQLVFEAPAEENDFEAGYKALDNIESEKVLGREKVSGYKCVKREVVTSMTVMGQSMKDKLIVWESDKFEMPLRTMDEDGSVQEMRNIDTAKPAKKLFRPMAGYKKVGSMMAVMGMDFGAMMNQDKVGQDEYEQAITAGQANESAGAQEAMMAHLQQSMGDNLSPEEKAQMIAIMGQAMAQVNQTNPGQGASKDLWKIIPKRGGDKVGYEMKIQNTIDVILGTNSTLQQVFDFYGKELSSKGWKNQSTYIQDGQGMMSLQKGGETVLFAWAEKPAGMKENFKLFYNVHYAGN